MRTGASEMSGGGGGVSGQVWTSLGHDNGMARLMDAHTTHTHIQTGDEMK